MDTKKVVDAYSKVKEKLNAYIPETIVLNPMTMVWYADICYQRAMAGILATKTANSEYENYRIKVLRRIHSNNWLKLHGYPMRRSH